MSLIKWRFCDVAHAVELAVDTGRQLEEVEDSPVRLESRSVTWRI